MGEKSKLEAALDELLAGKTTAAIVGPDGLLKQLTKALVERAMNAELSHHLGYEKTRCRRTRKRKQLERAEPKKDSGRFWCRGNRDTA